MVLLHGFFHFRFESFALTHRFHRLECQFWFNTLANQIVHDIITTANTLVQRDTRLDQFGGISQPDIGSMRQARNTKQIIKRGRFGVLHHTAHKFGTKFRYSQTAQLAQNGVGCVVYIVQCFVRRKQAHHIGVIQRDFLRIHAGQILQTLDNGRVIMPQLVQFEQVRVDGVILEMRGDNIRSRVICRMLYRTKIINFNFFWYNHDTAGVLTSGTANTRTTGCQPVFFSAGAL